MASLCSLRQALAGLAVAAAGLGCGSAGPWPPWGPGAGGAAAPGGSTPQTPAAPAAASPPEAVVPASAGPLETYLAAGTVVPSRVRAPSLVVRFRSNAADAAFDCRLNDAADFGACAGDTYDFGALVHARSYALAVRARTRDGRVARTPLVVAFVADLLAGTPPTLPGPAGAPAHVPTTVAQLAKPADDLLQVGSYFLVTVPYGVVVTSYSTSKTYNASIHAMRLLDVSYSSVYPGLLCDKVFERIVTLADGRRYCDATPTSDQAQTAYAGPLPKNHVELVMLPAGGASAGQVPDEKLFVAAFDAEADVAESHLGLAEVCRGAPTSGSTAVPALNLYYATSAQTATLSWCQVRSDTGVYWWVGTMTAGLGPEPLAPRLRVTYTANARLGLVTGQAFALRASARLTTLLQPLAPAPGAR